MSVASATPATPRSRAARRALPILLYHAVSDVASSAFRPWAVTPGTFADQVDRLVDLGLRGVSVGELLSAAHAEDAGRMVGITFDDAFADVSEHALPILGAAGFTCTIYAPTAYVGGRANWLDSEGEGERVLMSWDQLREAAREGHEIGAHSHTHPHLDLMAEADLRRELVMSRRLLAEHLGETPRSVAYPHGYYNRRVLRAARAAGYETGVAVRDAFATLAEDRLALSRALVLHDLDAARFGAIAAADPVLPTGPLPRRARRLAWRAVRRIRGRGSA